ncbi:uncharacterized protein LOC128093119 [Culex pipiens pallens]|uniref:uncharacterized protein LOC128093119 n=1 Tax=Culex pipiens pallens TaxID=42434 RepID=UPI0022AAFC3A|nr:uncharacterized protein LOC128093119 [Culex pipiens pallens]
MSRHLKKVYDAAFRKRKREQREEERQLADEPAAVPVDNAERRGRKRAAEGGGEHGEDDSGAGPSVSNIGKRRRQGREGGNPGGSNASGSTSAERMRRLRERRKRTGQNTFGRSDQGGETTDDCFVAGRRRRGGRGLADNLVAENPVHGISPPMEADAISLHDPVVQIDEEGETLNTLCYCEKFTKHAK